MASRRYSASERLKKSIEAARNHCHRSEPHRVGARVGQVRIDWNVIWRMTGVGSRDVTAPLWVKILSALVEHKISASSQTRHLRVNEYTP